MAAKLGSKGEETVKVEFKLPSSLKSQAVTMASKSADGDLSGWLRDLIRREWKKWSAGGKGENGGAKFLP